MKKFIALLLSILIILILSSGESFSVQMIKDAKMNPFVIKTEKPLTFFCFSTDPFNIPDFNFSIIDFDLAIKFLFMEEKIPFDSLQKEYEKLLYDFTPLLKAQFDLFKYHFAKEMRAMKKFYVVDLNKLDDDQYIKNRFKVIYYGNDGFTVSRFIYYLFSKLGEDEKIEAKIDSDSIFSFQPVEFTKAAYISFVNFPIFYFCKMLLSIDRFKFFFEKYREKVESLIFDYNFIELYNIYCGYFDIHPKKNIFFFFDFLDEIYFLKGPVKDKKHPDFEEYRKANIFAYSLLNSFTFSFKSLSSKALYIPMFFHELTHFFQQKSKWNSEENYSSLEDPEKRYFTYKLPKIIDDFSGWNLFLSSFSSSGKYIFLEFDAQLTSLEITKKVMEEKIYQNYDLPQIYDYSEFIDQIYIFFLIQYKEYCEEKGIKQLFYVQNFDPDIEDKDILSFSNPNNDTVDLIRDNYYKFFYNKIYKNRNQILKMIHRAVRYFEPYLLVY